MAHPNFFAELKRRNVYKVAIAYVVIAWLLVEVAALVFRILQVPVEILESLIVVAAGGFIVALIISWFFEMTPAGMKRTEEISPDERLPYWSRRKFAALIVGLAMIATALFLFEVLF